MEVGSEYESQIKTAQHLDIFNQKLRVSVWLRLLNIAALIIEFIAFVMLIQVFGVAYYHTGPHAISMIWSCVYQIIPVQYQNSPLRFIFRLASLLIIGVFFYSILMFGFGFDTPWGPNLWHILIMFYTAPALIVSSTLLIMINNDEYNDHQSIIGSGYLIQNLQPSIQNNYSSIGQISSKFYPISLGDKTSKSVSQHQIFMDQI